jgi:hypothetical protein
MNGLNRARRRRSQHLLTLAIVRARVVLQRIREAHLERARRGEGALRIPLAARQIDDDPHADTAPFGLGLLHTGESSHLSLHGHV